MNDQEPMVVMLQIEPQENKPPEPSARATTPPVARPAPLHETHGRIAADPETPEQTPVKGKGEGKMEKGEAAVAPVERRLTDNETGFDGKMEKGEAAAMPEHAAAEPISNRKSDIVNDPLPARMLNEFVYCPRLFYYEFVEGVFVENADTARGAALHQRVDAGTGALPKGKGKGKMENEKGTMEKADQNLPATSGDAASPLSILPSPLPDVIHSRSVQMGSERLGVTAKMDLVEARVESLTTENAKSAERAGETGDLR
ncbi:MAG: hypothetical protein HY360_15810 [Verrucomicrobia bacterium]|nr:hypothetical protein [Verrucomicrobiota bacterium]